MFNTSYTTHYSAMPAFMGHQESDDESNFIEVTDIPTKKLLLKNESLGSEKQISVDPISLKAEKESSDIVKPGIPAYPSKTLLSLSTTSSLELYGSATTKKNQYYYKNLMSPLSRQHSVALTNLQHLKEIQLHRSKSCGEGRASAPPEEFDLWFVNNNSTSNSSSSSSSSAKCTHDAGDSNKLNSYDSSIFHEESEGDRTDDATYNMNSSSVYDQEEKFKCGALCLFIPGRFGKGKLVRSRRQESGLSSSSELALGHHHHHQQQHVVSRTVSLEKFECGSWTSSAIINEDEGSDTSHNHLFFDLPMELIRCNANDDTHSPVTTAFVFDKEVKGVLKNTTTSRKSHESTRHVRFSTSSPTSYPPSPTSPCITPQLRKAREDFTTFLEAQSAS